jgi:multisubunit Na+/H+ antiporter MnhE subunit
VTAKDVVAAATPALLIVLGLGGLIHPVAPITLLVAWALSSRVRVAPVEIRAAFALAVVILTVFGVVLGFLGIAFDFADWWDMVASVAMVLSWSMIAAVIVLARRALRAARPPRPPGTTWG